MNDTSKKIDLLKNVVVLQLHILTMLKVMKPETVTDILDAVSDLIKNNRLEIAQVALFNNHASMLAEIKQLEKKV